MAAAMPCKRKARTGTTKVAAKEEIASQTISKNDLWLNSGFSWIHKATTDSFSHEKTWRSPMTHNNLVHQFIAVPQAMRIRDARVALDCEWQKLETIPAWKLEKVKSKKEVILEAQRDKKRVHFATLMDLCHQKNAELEPNIFKIQRRSRAPWWHCERRLVSVPNDCRKSNGCYCKITRLWRTSS